MTGDVCECGICDVESCDLCGAPVAFVDDEGEAWCGACWARWLDAQAEVVWLRWGEAR